MQRNFIAFKVRSKCSGSLFDVSSIWSFLFLFPKTESVKQKFTYSCLCGSNSCCTMYWSHFLRKKKKGREKKSRKTLGFLFESCCCIVDTRPAADSRLVRRSWTKVRREKKKKRLKGRSGLYGINLKEADGPHVNTVTGPVLMDNHTPGKVSPSDSDWQIQEAVLLQCWMASSHNTRGVIRSCQSNMR